MTKGGEEMRKTKEIKGWQKEEEARTKEVEKGRKSEENKEV